MLKPLIFILILITLLSIGINLNLFDETTKVTTIKNHLPKKSPITEKENIPVEPSSKNVELPNIETTQESNLSNELLGLLKIASAHFQKSEDSEAFKLYNEVIKRTENSNDPKILKIFANALFRKATLNNIYPNNDPESAIEDYNRVIKKFKNSDNIELLKLYIEARLKQAKLQSSDELFTTYDELIKRFSKDKEQRFDKEVEELQLSKSFYLMGDNAEEAMEVLDTIIAKYQARGDKKLPQVIGDSILNNIELSIITSNDDEKYVDLANKYLSENKDTAPLLDMLNIIKNAQDLDQHEAIEQWMNKHKDYHFSDWDFSELSEWANKMENPEGQKRIKEYLDIFLKQKYTRPNGNQVVYSEHEVTTPSSGIDNNTYEELPPSEEIEEVPEVYETNEPYIKNDTYETDNLYPNPYEELPKDPNDGVTHTYIDEGNEY